LRPNSSEASQGRVAALQRLGRGGEAVQAGPAPGAEEVPGAEAAVARGRALIELDRPLDALTLLSKVTVSGGQGARIAIARSAALWKLGRAAEALSAARAAARLDPASGDVHEEYAYLLLKLGDFERGWEEYEFRLDKPPGRMRRADFRAPVWRGEDLTGKRIIVSPEQGLGDTVQFARYLPLLIERGARVAAVVQKSLLGVMRSMRSPIRWLSEVPADESFDYQVPLMSLAQRFATRLETIPREVPYLFAVPERVAKWRERIGPEGFRIGIVWQGNPEYASDPSRSIALAEFAPLASAPGARLISLQAQRGLAQLQRLPSGIGVESLGADITANPEGLTEIAAAMEALDLIVTSDTAVAHLAGALGRPVWVALSHDPDWRWMRGRGDSPWYPTMRLFRQPSPGDWPSVFAAISKALA
jgi:tetratricopeptide (TPR) repeat protein